MSYSESYSPTLEELVRAYRNTESHNDEIHQRLTAATRADPRLAPHRSFIETHHLGFGDAAFHALWGRLITAAADRFPQVNALEIGVYKGQVISLWTLLGKLHRIPLTVSALTPLAGNPRPSSRLLNWLLLRLSRRFQEQHHNGNFYENDDYLRAIKALYAHFELDFSRVILHRGRSTDPEILRMLSGASFSIIYIDGDHTYQGAKSDLLNFASKVLPGGWLVADDASFYQPGTRFWKGHEAVSRAVDEVMPGLGFKNILNVGHNRVFERVQ